MDKNSPPTAKANSSIFKGVGLNDSKFPIPATAFKIAFIKIFCCLTKTHQTSCKQSQIV